MSTKSIWNWVSLARGKNPFFGLDRALFSFLKSDCLNGIGMRKSEMSEAILVISHIRNKATRILKPSDLQENYPSDGSTPNV